MNIEEVKRSGFTASEMLEAAERLRKAINRDKSNEENTKYLSIHVNTNSNG